MGGSPPMPEIKMPPPAPPPAPMDAPDLAEADLEMATGPQEGAEKTTGSKRKYRKRTAGGGTGKSKNYKGGGLASV